MHHPSDRIAHKALMEQPIVQVSLLALSSKIIHHYHSYWEISGRFYNYKQEKNQRSISFLILLAHSSQILLTMCAGVLLNIHPKYY